MLLPLKVEDGGVMGVIKAVRPAAFVFVDEAVELGVVTGDFRGRFRDEGGEIEIFSAGFEKLSLNFNAIVRSGALQEVRELVGEVQDVAGVEAV